MALAEDDVSGGDGAGRGLEGGWAVGVGGDGAGFGVEEGVAGAEEVAGGGEPVGGVEPAAVHREARAGNDAVGEEGVWGWGDEPFFEGWVVLFFGPAACFVCGGEEADVGEAVEEIGAEESGGGVVEGGGDGPEIGDAPAEGDALAGDGGDDACGDEGGGGGFEAVDDERLVAAEEEFPCEGGSGDAVTDNDDIVNGSAGHGDWMEWGERREVRARSEAGEAGMLPD